MDDLIGTLRAQHAAMRELLSGIDANVTADDLASAQARLAPLRSALESHLALEDGRLYPGLRHLAQSTRDDHLAAIAAAFEGTMGNITEGLARILARYRADIPEGADFRRDWQTVKSVLESRMRAEESSLFQLYARASARAGR